MNAYRKDINQDKTIRNRMCLCCNCMWKLQSICVRIEQSEFGSYKNLLLLNLEAGRCGCSYLLLFCVRRLE